MMTVNIWVGNYGDYVIPSHLSDVRMTKNGWPDKRSKMYAEFMQWVKNTDKA